MQLESAGLQTGIYISSTDWGVIILSSVAVDKASKDFSPTLDLNPNYFETSNWQDTIIFLSGKKPTFNFSKVSSINLECKNEFNNTIDPQMGVILSKSN
jgi:hypothetical protein